MCRRDERKACKLVDFDFLALMPGFMRFDMTFDVTLRDDSSFGKLTKRLIFTFAGSL